MRCGTTSGHTAPELHVMTLQVSEGREGTTIALSIRLPMRVMWKLPHTVRKASVIDDKTDKLSPGTAFDFTQRTCSLCMFNDPGKARACFQMKHCVILSFKV
eukprot:3381603-Amphidinium_carterae.2